MIAAHVQSLLLVEKVRSTDFGRIVEEEPTKGGTPNAGNLDL